MGPRLAAAAAFLPIAFCFGLWSLATRAAMRGPAGAVGALLLLAPAAAALWLAVRVLRGRAPAWGWGVRAAVAVDALLLVAALAWLPSLRAAHRASAEMRTLAGLSDLRRALVLEYRDRRSFPPRLSGLVPSRLPVFPRVELPGTGHPASREARLSHWRDLTDSGFWLYANEPKDQYFGRVRIDCTHTDSRGLAWSAY